ncbi:YfhO family protein [Thermomicrobiaceae bacterium CFH 74404]|uniref:YfhO family protein n=1 Tax=Thermalbibacter longus TaxID=2951981 RepID=A0AA42BAH0_9BACT|nr:YfhO family protein [Thermalbibacter longus]MCM8749702.1 YfhO family protein [Thermalbibacter longus]
MAKPLLDRSMSGQRPAASPRRSSRLWPALSRLRRHVPTVLDLGFLAGFWLLYFWPLLVRQEYLIPYDIIEQHYMFQAFVHRSLVAGQAPWWTPHILGGYPLTADPLTMLFYPPALAMHALAWREVLLPYLYLEWLAALHVLWAAAGTYLLARSLTGSRAGAVLAALTYAFGAFFAMHLPHLSALAGLSWLPWIVLAFRRALRERSLFWIGLAALAFGMMALAGHALTMLQIGYLLLGLTLLATWRRRSEAGPALEVPEGADRSHGDVTQATEPVGSLCPTAGADGTRRPSVPAWKSPLRLAVLRAMGGNLLVGLAVVALGAGLAMVQLLPSWELGAHTERANFPYEEAVVSSIQPHWLVTMALPNFFATDGPAPYWGSGDPAETNLYAGLLPLFLAALGVARARPEDRRATALLAVGALLALVLAFGEHTWVYRVAYDLLPGVDRVRRPANYVALLHLALALLAAYGVKALEREPAGGGSSGMLLRWLRGALLLALGLLVLGAFLLARSAGGPGQQVMQGIVDGVVLAGLVLLAAYSAMLARVHWHLPLSLLLVLLVGIAAFDLGTATASATYKHHRMRPDSYIGLDWAGDPSAPTVRLLLEAQRSALPERFRILPKQAGSIWENGPLLWRLDSAWGYSVLWPTYYRELFDAATADPNSPLFDLLNVRYLLTPGPIEEVSPGAHPGKFSLVHQGAPWIYENRSVGPRVWVASQAIPLPEAEQIPYLREHAGALRDVVVLDEGVPIPPIGRPGSQGSGPAGSAEILRYENTRVVIRASLAEPAFVVLADTFYPGWEASVDGAPARLYRANHAFRAVWVPAGEHEVELRFAPTTLRLGSLVSALALLVVTGLVVLGLGRRRGRSSAPDSGVDG